MADVKTSALTALTGANSATGDKLLILDVSDTTQGAGGTLKNMTRAEMLAAMAAEGAIKTPITLSAATGDENGYDLALTVNKATSGNYTGLKLNVTETAAPGSADKLMDLQVGGTSKFNITNDGKIVSAYNGAGGLSFSNNIGISIGSFNSVAFGGGRLTLSAESCLSWTSVSNNSLGAIDLYLYREAASILAQRNSTNSQTYNIYGTYTDASNYERLSISGGGTITTAAAGTGTRRDVVLSGANRASKINDPSGGATVDAESRTAINAIIDALESHGISATS